MYEENAVPICHSERTTKGQEGELQQKQTISKAVQPHQGPKQNKTCILDISNNIDKSHGCHVPKAFKAEQGRHKLCIIMDYFNY